MIVRRKHCDPKKWPYIAQIENFSDSMTDMNHTWIILDRGLASMVAEINSEEQVTQLRLGKHLAYFISYFNSFALLLKLVSDENIIHRCLTISDCNSILMALENIHNRDWRVIELTRSTS